MKAIKQIAQPVLCAELLDTVIGGRGDDCISGGLCTDGLSLAGQLHGNDFFLRNIFLWRRCSHKNSNKSSNHDGYSQLRCRTLVTPSPTTAGLQYQLFNGCRKRGAAMNWFNKLFKLVLIVATASQITACAKTVTWEEEVLLNTGEIIWVTKEVRYSIKGQPGNPLDLGYVPDFVETTSFKYDGKTYTYKGDAGIFVLAISPQRVPVLLAPPEDTGWYRHNEYKCVIPYYVQLMPDPTGQTWSWPERIDAWTYNLSANLLMDRDRPPEAKRRYTLNDKARQAYLKDPRLSYLQKIQPLFTGDRCKGSK